MAIAALAASSGCVAAVAGSTHEQQPAHGDDGLQWGDCPPNPESQSKQAVDTDVFTAPSERDASGDDPLQCADLDVPVDHEKPGGRTITLKLGRLPATGKSEGSVLVAYGGPGAPGIEITRQNVKSWAELRSRMDIVTWDTRGYGKQWGGLSDGLPCTWTRLPLPEIPRGEAAFDRQGVANLRLANLCRDQDPEFFDHMSSADQARDMEAMRKALAEPKLNFYGSSYAGLYAQAYARLFPDRVRTLVLDGTLNHSSAEENNEDRAMARANHRSLGRFFDWCENQKSCAASDSDPAQQWRQVIEKANQNPMRAKANGLHYRGIDLQAFGLTMAKAGPDAWPELAKAIRQGRGGDASGFVAAGGPVPYPDATTPITECLDWPRPHSAAELQNTVHQLREASPSTGAVGTIPRSMLQCAGWPAPVSNPPEPLPSDLPPLLAAGAWGEDEASKRAIDNVPGSTVISVDGPGHTLYLTNDCAREHINRYVTDRVLPDAPDGNKECPA